MPKPKQPNQTKNPAKNNGDESNNLTIDAELRSVWLGRRDSNPRMHGPKPCALPLGHAPSDK